VLPGGLPQWEGGLSVFPRPWAVEQSLRNLSDVVRSFAIEDPRVAAGDMDLFIVGHVVKPSRSSTWFAPDSRCSVMKSSGGAEAKARTSGQPCPCRWIWLLGSKERRGSAKKISRTGSFVGGYFTRACNRYRSGQCNKHEPLQRKNCSVVFRLARTLHFGHPCGCLAQMIERG